MRRIGKLCAAAALGTALWSPDVDAYKIKGGVVGAGGHPAMGSSNGVHVLYGTIGQPVVGYSIGSSHGLCHGFWCAGGARVVAVAPPGSDVPGEAFLRGPTPNPSSGGVRFAIGLPRAEEVGVTIYDIRGREVFRSSRELPAGNNAIDWDGTDGSSRSVAAGVYFARLFVGGRPVTDRRVVVIR